MHYLYSFQACKNQRIIVIIIVVVVFVVVWLPCPISTTFQSRCGLQRGVGVGEKAGRRWKKPTNQLD